MQTGITPHGGKLRELFPAQPPADFHRLPFIKLNLRQQCEVEMLLCGAFSPLPGFMGRDDYLAVLQTRRLSDGTLWPLPVTLDLPRETLSLLGSADRVLLLDAELHPVALLEIGESWQPDLRREAKIVYGSDDPAHPGVRRLLRETEAHYVSGRLTGISLPRHHEYCAARLTPAAQRAELAGRRCLAFLPQRPLRDSDAARIGRAVEASGADCMLLLHSPYPGAPGAPPRITAQCLQAAAAHLQQAALRIVPLAPRHAGIREEILRAIVCQNHGASHYLMNETADAPFNPDTSSGRAGFIRPSANKFAPTGNMSALCDHLAEAQEELAIRLIAPEDRSGSGADGHGNKATPDDEARHARSLTLPSPGGRGDEGSLREFHADTVFPREAQEILRRHFPPRARQGFALLLTGLSGSGKSTLAHLLRDHIEQRFRRNVTLLDGDYARGWLTAGLGADPRGQWQNVLRHAEVAAEITRHGGVAICALVAPDAAARHEARQRISAHGGYLEIRLAATPEVCEKRDAKGIYARARAGLLPTLAGVGLEYETGTPDLILDSENRDAGTLARQVLEHLAALGYL